MAELYAANNDELWRECANWLTQWDVLRSDHRTNWPNASIVDLANTLRDGVLLCNLVNKMDPGCIDIKDVNLKPAMAQFLCLRNINIFLRSCHATFGLRESDLFDPLMLFDLSNFHRVLCTISKLSRSPKALKSRQGFSAQNVKSSEEEDIYQSLKTVELPNRTGLNAFEYEDYAEYDNRGEEIYQDLCSLQQRSSAEFVGAHVPLEKRDYVIKELVETEHNYVEVINKLKKNFMRPLQGHLKPEHHAIIFCKINELHEIHTGFLSQLLKVGSDKSIKLSHVFMTWRARFLIYGDYCANLSNACSILQEQCDKDEFLNQAIIKCEKEDNNGRFKLRDVLSVPMQRILKYHLLLEKLIELTDPNHEEYQDLKKAREIMLDVAGFINEAARDSEHLAVIKKVYENITEWDVTSELKLEDCGRLIKDGELKIKAHDDQKTRNRYAFIFDKVMVLCKQIKGNQFAYRSYLHLPDYRVELFNNRAVLNREARWSYQWHLVKHDQSLAYTLYARTIEIRNKMVKALTEAIENVRPTNLSRTNHKFEMYTFERPTLCFRCLKYLKGIIFQGYKCKVCGVGVHKDCIATSGRCGAPPLPPPHSMNSTSQLSNKLWFVGEMDRTEASSALEIRMNGTYLVRLRSQREDRDKYALSLKTDGSVKHMRIYCNPVGSEIKYYLSLSKYFNSIEELVENYQKFSLKENFEGLEEYTKLEWPFKFLRCIAVKHFEPQTSEQFPLYEGQEVLVVGQEGYRENWWKGKYDNRVGYFPSSYVRQIEVITSDSL